MLERDAPRHLLDSLLHPARDMLEAKIEQAVVVRLRLQKFAHTSA